MSQERWDVIIRVIEGPLALRGDIVLQGPVVRLGADPGPGGLKLEGYRGLDNRQAVITAYDGGTVTIAPVGGNQVRVAPHENQSWAEVMTIAKPVLLSPGDAFHLGPPGRGLTATFVEARRLGVWEQKQLISEARAGEDLEPSDIKSLDAGRGRPLWFIPAILVVGMITSAGVLLSIVVFLYRPRPPIGPTAEGVEYVRQVELTDVDLDPSQLEGLKAPFEDFVMKPNAEASGIKALANRPEMWDQTFYKYVEASLAVHARSWAFWSRLELIAEDYGYVVAEMRKAKLPEVFAAIPYHESQYRAEARSPVCAKGFWQLMPEVAHRVDVKVRNCKMTGSTTLYTPTRVIPVRGVLKNAEYVGRTAEGVHCRIQSCEVDERTKLADSTRGSVELLREAFEDPVLAASGAVVQITILSHNSGYDNSRFEEKQENSVNILPSYKKYIKANNLERAVDFYGKNITCTGEQRADLLLGANERCGGSIANQSQHYAYNIVAQHLLAVCYYASNHGDESAFKPWNVYLRGDTAYCKALDIPTLDKIKNRAGKGGSP